jgi:hypothetical protein
MLAYLKWSLERQDAASQSVEQSMVPGAIFSQRSFNELRPIDD